MAKTKDTLKYCPYCGANEIGVGGVRQEGKDEFQLSCARCEKEFLITDITEIELAISKGRS